MLLLQSQINSSKKDEQVLSTWIYIKGKYFGGFNIFIGKFLSMLEQLGHISLLFMKINISNENLLSKLKSAVKRKTYTRLQVLGIKIF